METRSEVRFRRAGLNRRDLLRWAALSPLALATSAEAARARPPQVNRLEVPEQREPTAGDWKTWYLTSLGHLLPGAPPAPGSIEARVEAEDLVTLQRERGDAARDLVLFWDAQGGILAWTQILLTAIRETRTNPVRAARALALFHTTLADATIVAWTAKYRFGRLQPSAADPRIVSLSRLDYALPSYPSEHAAVAAAAATVLSDLFPGYSPLIHGQRMSFAAAAEEAALSRLWAGASFLSDIEAGFPIGEAVGALAVARGQYDGSSATWDPATQPGRRFGPPYWVPTPPGNLFPPLEVAAATWKPWLMSRPSQFRPAPPPALQGEFPSARFLAETLEVKRAVDHLTRGQRQIALYWADNPGESYTPPGHWAQIAAAQLPAAELSTPRAARALALVSVGLADSAIACWDTKFTYWLLRPITAIRTLVGQPFHDPAFLTPVVTPPFPAYTSGHSTFSGCSAAVLAHLFPQGTVKDAFGQDVSFEEAAEQAAVSRLYGGIHYRSDNEEGLVCGRHIAELVIQRAQSDGADPVSAE